MLDRSLKNLINNVANTHVLFFLSRSLQHSALREIEDSVQVFSNLVRKVQKAQAELVIAIEEKQRKTAQWAQGLIEEIEREIVQLTKRNCEIDHLARTDDHIYFLQVKTCKA